MTNHLLRCSVVAAVIGVGWSVADVTAQAVGYPRSPGRTPVDTGVKRDTIPQSLVRSTGVCAANGER